MTSDTKAEDQLAAELARKVVARTAPQELPMFRATSVAYFKDPDQAFKGKPKEEMLGFGVETIAFLTPYALAIAKPVIRLLTDELAKNLKERSSEVIAKWIRRMFGKQDEPTTPGEPAPEPLTPEQLGRIRQLALERGRELDLPEREAGLLADAMIGSLVLGRP